MRKWKGSYTVEAAIIVPIMIWTMAIAMCTGITMWQQIQNEHEEAQIQELWAVEAFYKYQVLKEVTK